VISYSKLFYAIVNKSVDNDVEVYIIDTNNNANEEATMEQQILETIENALIDRMAKEVGVQAFQMKSMIMRCEELKQYYKQIRSNAIKDLADNFKKNEAA
jgi:predicted peroxiredoxin